MWRISAADTTELQNLFSEAMTTQLSLTCGAMVALWAKFLWDPLFPGNTGVDQLVEIIKVLGAPNKEDLRRMNPTYQEFKFPKIKAHNFVNLFPVGTDREAIDIVTSLLKYLPESRTTAIQLVFSDFFCPNSLRRTTNCPTGSP